MAENNGDIVILGAGIIGLAAAFWLARAGHAVTVVDQHAPCTSASFGNACTIATYGCVPIATPRIVPQLPALLLNPQSPFTLNWRHILRLTPWLWAFMRQTRMMHCEHNARALASLQQEAWPAYTTLLNDCDAWDLIRHKGSLYFATSDKDLQSMTFENDLRTQMGVAQTPLDAQQVAALEPVLAGRARGGTYFPDARHVDDPFQLGIRLSNYLTRHGVRFVRAHIQRLEADDKGVHLYGDNARIRAHKLLVCAGAWSKPLAQQLGETRILLDVERGYHIEIPCAGGPPLSRPCCAAGTGFYMTPLTRRLRVAGLVELGSYDDKPAARRYTYLARHARALTGISSQTWSAWYGLRPSMPDALPVLSRSSTHAHVYYAFGHGHLGLSLAAITGRIMSRMVRDEPPLLDLAPFRIKR